MQTNHHSPIGKYAIWHPGRVVVTSLFLVSAAVLLLTACKKLVSIGEPISSLTSTEVFKTDEQANSAMAGIYSQMINASIYSSFGNGAVSLLGGYSADEFNSTLETYYPFSNNNLIAENAPNSLWQTAYSTIYGANSVIEGIAAASSGFMHDSIKRELTGEAKFIRAFSYFYLTNYFGDVPLVLTIDFNKTAKIPGTPQNQVYQQIVKDLQEAQAVLPNDYSVGGGERIRPNKMAAAAMLARVYLYTGDYVNAAVQAGTVISNTAQYNLVDDPGNVFLKNSAEAIWQLQQSTSSPLVGNATPEGTAFMPIPLATGVASLFTITDQLMNAFEKGDRRRAAWIDSSLNTGNTAGLFYFPYKYKTGKHNFVVGGVASEYYMVLRLAEQYLIRAEAEANGAPGGIPAAIADLDLLRARAGLAGLSSALSPAEVLAAVAHERQIEFFAEWGHRWLDLKRTGKAHEVLSQMINKQPWKGDYQLLYPIPLSEIRADPNLVQNAGY